MATDPVCGMTVDPAKTAHHLELDGETFYFCCAGCRAKLQEDPERYLRPAPSGDEAPAPRRAGTATVYTCPMHPDVRQQGPGSCPQ